MIDRFYSMLEAIGFTHPLHPVLVHLPMGLVFGAFVFSILGLIWHQKHFTSTAYHCAVLALITVFPVYIAGLMDWQYVFAGDMSKWIVIKMVLGVLLALTLVFVIMAKRSGASQTTHALLYFVALAICGGLGYSGGELLYGG